VVLYASQSARQTIRIEQQPVKSAQVIHAISKSVLKSPAFVGKRNKFPGAALVSRLHSHQALFAFAVRLEAAFQASAAPDPVCLGACDALFLYCVT
jgi:hypothetical protein